MQLSVSVQMKSSSVRMAEVIRSKNVFICLKKSSSVRMTEVIHLNKIFICSNVRMADFIHLKETVVVRMAAAIRSCKTNQLFDRPAVSDAIQVFKWLGLSVEKELYTAARMAVLV